MKEGVAAPQAAPPARRAEPAGPQRTPAREPARRSAGLGNQAALRSFARGNVSLSVAGDPHETGAERLAEQAFANAASASAGAWSGGAVSGSNLPLPESGRRFFEAGFGHDLSHVRIHADGEAATAARTFNARAFTVGSDIYLGDGHRDLSGEAGQDLLAHELAHVVQQASDTVPPNLVARMQEKGDLEAFIEALDGQALNAVLSQAFGSVQWGLTREVLKGFAGHVAGLPEEQKAAIAARFQRLASVWSGYDEKADFALGFLKGLVKGVFSPIIDIVDLVKTGIDVHEAVLDWFVTQGSNLMDGTTQAQVKAEVELLLGEADVLKTQVGEAVRFTLDHPDEAMQMARKLAGDVGTGAMGLARSVGAAAAGQIVGLLELPWDQLGAGVGNVVGNVISEVIMAALSAGAANGVRQGVRALTRAVDLLRSAPFKALRWVVEGAEKLMQMGRNLKRIGVKAYGDVMAAVERMFERVMNLINRLMGGAGGKALQDAEAAAAKAAARPAKGPHQSKRSRGRKADEPKEKHEPGRERDAAPAEWDSAPPDEMEEELLEAEAPDEALDDTTPDVGEDPEAPLPDEQTGEIDDNAFAAAFARQLAAAEAETEEPEEAEEPPVHILRAGSGAPAPRFKKKKAKISPIPEWRAKGYDGDRAEAYFLRSIHPDWQHDKEKRAEIAFTKLAAENNFDTKGLNRFDPTVHKKRNFKSGPRRYKMTKKGFLKEASTTRLLPGIRDPKLYAGLKSRRKGKEDYGHLLGVQFGHLDAEFGFFGGAAQLALFNRPSKNRMPTWYKTERAIFERAVNLQAQQKRFRIVTKAKGFDRRGVPKWRRIYLVSGGVHDPDSGWLRDRLLRSKKQKAKKGARRKVRGPAAPGRGRRFRP